MTSATKSDPEAQAQWEANVAHAERCSELINRLLETDAWQSYYLVRLRERRALYAKELENEQTEESTLKLRSRISEIDEIIRMPEQDRAAHASTLARARR